MSATVESEASVLLAEMRHDLVVLRLEVNALRSELKDEMQRRRVLSARVDRREMEA